MLVRISGAHFCAGAITDKGVVVEAAPIIRYMIGWRVVNVFQYAQRRRWKVTLTQ